ALCAAFISFAATRRARPSSAWVDETLGGPAFVELVDAIPDGAHVYAPFAPSSLVIWLASARGVRVFFDPRNDCYGFATWVDWKKIRFGEDDEVSTLLAA